ncbi:hypothetical protein E4U42_007452 [Claviceps africana]|uniref:Uncharacterized protein n=1 Tax=Claviceps africana TaxID=83212 RepID=A0A8K0J3V7_9HYPO|nr:hypothetical protein E4U42_007452 [Claviceps africana]
MPLILAAILNHTSRTEEGSVQCRGRRHGRPATAHTPLKAHAEARLNSGRGRGAIRANGDTCMHAVPSTLLVLSGKEELGYIEGGSGSFDDATSKVTISQTANSCLGRVSRHKRTCISAVEQNSVAHSDALELSVLSHGHLVLASHTFLTSTPIVYITCLARLRIPGLPPSRSYIPRARPATATKMQHGQVVQQVPSNPAQNRKAGPADMRPVRLPASVPLTGDSPSAGERCPAGHGVSGRRDAQCDPTTAMARRRVEDLR